ncbi:MAG TPA: radical SAM protein [Streptosporangiaceae bacterium]|nr:radical SAM protein [Streptosporangiaceae bacterium]
MKQDVEIMPSRPAAPGPAPAVTGPRDLRTSSYVIYVDLPRDDRNMLLVHGYTGAFDKVSRRVATFVRGLEDRRAPKPLYGDWAPEPAREDSGDLADQHVDVLVKRGYLTYLTREEELRRFTDIADGLHARPSPPGYVIMPTYDCNLPCFYCFQDQMRTRPELAYLLKRMTIPMADRIFDAMPQIEARHGIAPGSGYARPITLFGGEPLLRDNRDLIEHILDRAHAGGTPSVNAISNATDLDAYADLLGADGIAEIQVTIDGLPAEHDQRRVYADGQGSFARIARNITMALARGTRISVRLNIDRANIADLPQLARTFAERGWTSDPGFRAHASPIHPANDKTDRASTFSSWELDQALDELRAADPAMEDIYRLDDRLTQRARSIFDAGGHMGGQPTFCGAHEGMYVVDRFGDLYACWERTGNAKIRIGRIKPDATIEMDAVNDSMWRSRTVTSNRACAQCRYALFCGGGCAVLAEGRRGRIDRNYCDGYAERFRAMVADAYADSRAGKAVIAAASPAIRM